MNRVHSPWVFGVLLCGALGCSSENPNNTGGGGASGDGGGGAGAGMTTSDTTSSTSTKTKCEGPVVAGSGDVINIASVEATVVDLDSNPIPDLFVQVCGTDICLNGQSDAQGHVFVTVAQDMTQPAFKAGDGINYAKVAIPITESAQVLDKVFVVPFPPIAEGKAMSPGQSVTSSEMTLDIPADGQIEIDILQFETPEQQAFRAAQIPKEFMDPSVVSTYGLELFFAATPVDTLFCPPAKVTLPNTEGWPAGAAVEIWAHGLDIGEEWASYGGWAKVSDGAVSGDGATLSGDLPLLSVVGVKQK